MKDKAGSSAALDKLTQQFEQAIDRRPIDLDLLSKLTEQLHALDEPEWKKIRKKDDWINFQIPRIQNKIVNAGWMPQGEAEILLLIVQVLKNIESVLQELKDKVFPPEGGGRVQR